MKDFLTIKGARQHNLKNIDLVIPKNKLVVFTGVSGSGKSSMAFDTIYAEGQRRYVESLSTYARQFLGIMNKPDVEAIEGLSPAISIDQKSTGHNPRSTVGTITEIYDYLRLLYARIGHPHCPKCNREISKQSSDQISDSILNLIEHELKDHNQVRIMLLSPVVRDKKGEFSSLFSNLRSQGYQRVRIDNRTFDLSEDFLLIKTNKHTIEVILDRISISKKQFKDKIYFSNIRSRIMADVEQSLELSFGLVICSFIRDKDFSFPEKPNIFEDHLFSEHFSCPYDNISLPEIEPRSFSFNAPHGACPNCNGLGMMLKVDPILSINPDLSISQGAILPFARLTLKDTWFRRKLFSILDFYQESHLTPWKYLSHGLRDLILFGDQNRSFTVYTSGEHGNLGSFESSFEGIINILEKRYKETDSDIVRLEIEKYMRKETCPECLGKRLRKESLAITMNSLNIFDVTELQIEKTIIFIDDLKNNKILSEKELFIASPILKELQLRLGFLHSVGLGYLTLNREASTLAGGEAQRIRLASQIGSGLSGVLYILDEPTIGLHQKDNQKLLKTLKNLRDLGNTVVVVEHDRETILNADWIVDFGPGAGKYGGIIVATGKLSDIKKSYNSLTGKYLSGKRKIKYLKNNNRKKYSGDQNYADIKNNINGNLTLLGCSEHNLKNIDVTFPLGKFICVTGVSGSGKSTLVNDILYHALMREINFFHREKPGDFKEIRGVGEITRVILIDQSPIGRTPRSNPATYTKLFDDIRNHFSLTKESAIRGFKKGRFSFNVRGGRCEECQGCGQVRIEMQFLPDVYVTCEICHGTRYNSETLEIKYRGKSIHQVLKMNVAEAFDFFRHLPNLKTKLQILKDVGLGYIELGQPAPTLSGGEAQRLKIARELSAYDRGHVIYILDEPTTGLHFADLEKLLIVLKRLVENNNTVIIIEHNLDIVKNADYIIDLGPDGGDLGGYLVACGSPAEISLNKHSYTGNYLKNII